jgi:hypothetical protein
MRSSAALALAAALAGCGGTSATPTATTARPTITSAADRAICAVLESNVRTVSELVSGTATLVTQSLHPKQLARRTGQAKQELQVAADALATVEAPTSLVPARNGLVRGLREFAADLGRARQAVLRNDLAAASQELTDQRALMDMTSATRTIDRTCGA